MIRVESMKDGHDGVVTYEFPDGRRVRFDARVVAEHGLRKVLQAAGLGCFVPEGRTDVIQDGELVGTVPADFEPMFIKSQSFWYEPRRGDFVREGDKWIANKMLGPGDLRAVQGFIPAANSPPQS